MKKDFKLDFRVAKQKALHDWVVGLIEEVINDVDKKRINKEKYDVIKQIIIDASECEEDLI